jgi:hypothetical protein
VNAEKFGAMVHVAQHPEIVLAVVDPVAHVLVGEGILLVVRFLRVLRLEVRQQDAAELAGVDRVRQRPFDDVMVGFRLLGAVAVLGLVAERRVFHTADEARQIKLFGEPVVHLLVGRRFQPLVVGGIEGAFVQNPGILMDLLGVLIDRLLVLEPLDHSRVFDLARRHGIGCVAVHETSPNILMENFKIRNRG